MRSLKLYYIYIIIDIDLSFVIKKACGGVDHGSTYDKSSWYFG